MEKIIILLLLVIILFLLIEKHPTLKKKIKEKPSIPKPTSPKKKKNNSVIGKSNYTPKEESTLKEEKGNKNKEKTESSYPAEIPEEDLEDIFSEEINRDEEEELRAMRTPEEDDNFATGLSFDELNQVEPLLTKDNLSEGEKKQATTIAQKLEDTDLLDKIEEVLPKARQRVTELLERELKSPPTKSKEDFDIGDFV